MRPFFLLAMLAALLLLAWWSLALAAHWPLPPMAGGALVWHAHELILGFAMAAVAGFVLTALPEFTATAGARPRALQALVLLWLGARLGLVLSGWWGAPALWLAACAQVGLPLGLLAQLWPALRSPAGRTHQAFGWLLLALAGSSAGFYADALRGAPSLRWLHASLGLLMLLTVVAASRISMQILNRAIEQLRPGAPPYIARAPRRHLAALCIGLATVAEFFTPASHLAGWLALAASAAVLHLLTDWHVGAPLWRRRFTLLLYSMYLCMALGYAGLGLGALGLIGGALAAGRHLLTMGSVGLGIFIVIGIAGRAHVGRRPDPGPWLGLGGALLLLATAARVAAALGIAPALWLAVAGLGWCAAFTLLLWRIGPGLWQARSDGQQGCAGVLPTSP